MNSITFTRRSFLGSAVALSLPSLIPYSAFYAEAAADVKGRPIGPEDVYNGWPTLTRLRSGRLVVVWSGDREGHVCPFGVVKWMTSDDNGQSWTWPRTLLNSAIDDRDSGVLETAQGTLLVTSFTSNAYEPILAKAEKSGDWPEERLSAWQRVHDRLDDAQRRQQLGTWMLRSTDGGLTWSRRFDCLVNSPHGPAQLSDGRILYAGKQLWTPEQQCGFAVSADDGQSWNWLADLPVRPGDDGAQYHELHAVEAESGRLITHIRNHNSQNSGETLQCESSDGGKTWSLPHSIGVWGHPSHLLKLQDGRLVMTYGHRREPLSNQARVSEDAGRTWSSPIIVSSEETGDFGYPSTVELDDGSLLSVWYSKPANSPRANLRQQRWQLP